MITKKILLCLTVFGIFNAYADDNIVNDNPINKEEIVRALRDEIQQIDSEMVRCERTRKGWIAATIIGGTGVVATGTAAIVQGVKIKQQNNPKKETSQSTESKEETK